MVTLDSLMQRAEIAKIEKKPERAGRFFGFIIFDKKKLDSSETNNSIGEKICREVAVGVRRISIRIFRPFEHNTVNNL